jgi:excisionase family DNA binding protein
VSRPTIYKLIESGELPAHKKGRSWRISAAAVTERASR